MKNMSKPFQARGCPRCEDRKIVDPLFLNEAKDSFATLLVELIDFCNKNKIDHRSMPVLQQLARSIRILEMI